MGCPFTDTRYAEEKRDHISPKTRRGGCATHVRHMTHSWRTHGAGADDQLRGERIGYRVHHERSARSPPAAGVSVCGLWSVRADATLTRDPGERMCIDSDTDLRHVHTRHRPPSRFSVPGLHRTAYIHRAPFAPVYYLFIFSLLPGACRALGITGS